MIPTSNHNSEHPTVETGLLYIFWFLHQTTTSHGTGTTRGTLYIFWFLHQTATGFLLLWLLEGCISFDPYIKPQLQSLVFHPLPVVYLLIPTSNHNIVMSTLVCTLLYIFWFLHQTTTLIISRMVHARLYIFWFLHQTTTVFWLTYDFCSCISFDSYIKPQLQINILLDNPSCISFDSYIKPQLAVQFIMRYHSCISFDSYIKPQLTPTAYFRKYCCISFDSYIKPQLQRWWSASLPVVYLLIPTSNHN